MKHSSFLLGVLLALFLLPVCGLGQEPAQSDPSTPAADNAASPSETGNKTLLREAVEALDHDAPERAISILELLADRGFQHPDVSFNRAVAYVRRASSSRKRPGDLGRAAAALEETLVLRPSDEEALVALETVRSQIARRSVAEGERALAASPSPGRALTGLLTEDSWAILALLGSLFLALGLALRWWTHRTAWQLTGVVAAVCGASLALLAGGATAGSRHYRTTTTKAVIIAAGARLLDEQGAPVRKSGSDSLDRVPEGAMVHLGRQRGNLLEIEWGTVSGWIAATQVRRLPQRAIGSSNRTVLRP